MQNATPTPHSWQEFIYLGLVAVLGYGASFIPALFRKKQSEAETDKTRAETRSIDLQTTLHAGDMMLDLIKSAAQATLDVERLRKEKEFWQARAETLIAEKKIIELELDEQIRIGKPRE